MQTSSTSLTELHRHSTTLRGYAVAASSFSDLEDLSFGRACGSSVFVSYRVISVDTIRMIKVFYYGKTFGVMKMVTEKFLPYGLLDSLQEALVLL